MDIKYKTYIFFVVFIVFTTSCIKEDSSCGATVTFAYTHNILSTNAFENQVDHVTLNVFDKDGILVQQYTNGSMPLTNDFTMRLNNLKYGSYHFVVWAQSKHLTSDHSYFSIPSLTVGVSTIDELTYLMKRESGIHRHELNNLLIGMTDAVIDNGKTSITVYLRKVTKKIKVVILPDIPGNALNVEDYEFSIVDKVSNGHVNYDYMLLPDEPITYLPYYAANLEAETAGNVDRAIVVEINTSRLLEANAPRLYIVEKKGGKKIISMNLPWVFSLTGMENHSEWSLQEYLDRQDRYTIILYFSDRTWIPDTIIINGWVIKNKEVEF